MLITWETFPTITCLWMAIMIATQYKKIWGENVVTLCILYFITLFISGLPWLQAYGPALRLLASSLILVLVCQASGSSLEKKNKALAKIPLIIGLIAFYFKDEGRILSSLEGVIAIIMAIILIKNREIQGVRLRYFIKTTILGVMYLILKILFPAWGYQLLGMFFKLGALYYLYCWVNSYAAEKLLKQHSS